MKKLAISSILLLCVAAMLFGACDLLRYRDPWDLKKEDLGFYYYVVADDGRPNDITHKGTGAVILGLVDTKSEIDELVIPKKLGGYSVVGVGDYHSIPKAGNVYYGIYAGNIKKIIINHKIRIFKSGFEDFTGELIVNTYVELDSHNVSEAELIRFNFDLSLVDDYNGWRNYRTDLTRYEVLFNATGGEQKTYALIAKENNLLPEPEQPTKDGYVFDGWYADEEYENEWNFEEDAVTENITLYAKWIKN